MPTYVYRGLQTGTTFEVQQRITEDALKHHPETGEPVARVIQPVGIAFKGSGFYRNDSRAGGTKSETGSGGTKSETGSGGTKSETGSGGAKPESKADAKPASKPVAAAAD